MATILSRPEYLVKKVPRPSTVMQGYGSFVSI